MSTFLNSLDRLTGGRKDLILRLFSFLFIGGLGAMVNILCFTAAYSTLLPSASTLVAYFVAFLLATEVSMLTNFALNDGITFRHFRGTHRSWLTRCLRFHATSAGGTALTLGISFSLLHFVLIRAVLAQALALVIATAFNFVGHHVFTYRHVGEGVAAKSDLDVVAAHLLEQSSIAKTDM
jgi:putative flippase GtrA